MSFDWATIVTFAAPISVVSARYPFFGAAIRPLNVCCDTWSPTPCVGASADAIVRKGMNRT